ncbi:MAG: hypothetical protein Q7U54_18855 [Bacteroidales bacterium]|nr:hypothetical protein [Bacteroidales bacterium]
MEELLERLNNIYSEQTSSCSDICRKIVFVLLTMVGVLSYSNGKLHFTLCLIVLSLFLVLYLILDVLQYFWTAISYRKHFNEIIKASDKGIPFNEFQDKEMEKRSEINSLSFKLLATKVSLLPFIFLGVILALFEKMGSI